MGLSYFTYIFLVTRPFTPYHNFDVVILTFNFESHTLNVAITRLGGDEVAGWTLDRKIRVRFPAYPHREVKDVFGRPGARVEVGSAR